MIKRAAIAVTVAAAVEAGYKAVVRPRVRRSAGIPQTRFLTFIPRSAA